MNERAPGEVDALANGYVDLSIVIEKIRDNLRARRKAPDYNGFLTEEEADALFVALDNMREEADEARRQASTSASYADDDRKAAATARAELATAQELILKLQSGAPS